MDIFNLLFVLSLTILISSPYFSSSMTHSTLKEGSSLFVEYPGDILVSSNGAFSAGFYPVGDNAYCFAIWFSNPSSTSNSGDCPVVWMANRDSPVNGKRSRLSLIKPGNLVLTDAEKFVAWSSTTYSHSSTELILKDTGNLVLQNVKGVVIWQSFDSPTDTLLPLQPFTKDMKLTSSRSPTNFSSGFYKLFFNNDNLLRLLYDSPEVSSIYWPDPWLVSWATKRFAYNSSRQALLDSFGKFISSDRFSFRSDDYGVKLQRRLTLDFDGNLRLYSGKEDSKNNTTWVVSWQALSQPCAIHGTCGPNSKCSYDPFYGRKCSCLPGYKVKNTADWSYGCEPEFNLSCDSGSDQVDFIKLTRTELYGNDYALYPGYTLEMCKNLCLNICNCKGFQYRYYAGGQWTLFTLINNIKQTTISTVCYPKISLLNGHVSPNFEGDFYVKVPKSSLFSNKEDFSGFGLNCAGNLEKPLNRTYPESHDTGTLQLLFWFAWGLGVVEILVILFVWYFVISFRKDSYKEASQGYQHLAITGIKRFTYSELKQATGNFSLQIGRGSGGTVYKGKLADNRIAAIKRLNIANQGGEAEFLAEINIIGKINHMNLIKMWGYCEERDHRLLVYEYMEYGSLSKNLFSKALNWRKRFHIAIGTARGLAYLHEECLEWILHCDVKPQNILLDSNYNPKVSDFGLSKLLNRNDLNSSSFSRVRGTRGYMAPEWLFNLPITSKVDVYSYGIVVLQMVTGKSSPEIGVNCGEEGKEQRELVTWVRDKKYNGGETWIEEIVDPVFEGEFDRAETEILATLALQCVEEDKDARPTMSQVIQILLHHQNYI